MFSGFCQLSATLYAVLLVRNSSGVPVNADSLPTLRVYGPAGYMNVSGTCSLLSSGTITGATNASPIVVTSANHGLTTGARVTVSGVLGNTAANGTFTVTYVSSSTFSLDSSVGNGAYVSGGTWNVAGACRYQIACTEANGFAAGNNYSVIFTYAISSTQQGQVHSFQVV